jgi:hypothetical protein
MFLGTAIHEAFQEAAVAKWGADAVVVEAKVRWDDLDASGHIDLVVKANGLVYVLELKTMGGFAYKSSIGLVTGKNARIEEPEGPRVTAILQGALNALAYGADVLVIAEMALESVSKGNAAQAGLTEIGRFASEWHYTQEEYLPWAYGEKNRLGNIIDVVKADMLPDTFVVNSHMRQERLNPGNVNDKTGLPWQWQCAYCPHLEACQHIGLGEVPLVQTPWLTPLAKEA